MESLTTNDEQALSGAAVLEDGSVAYPTVTGDEAGGDLLVNSRREFFQELDEVQGLLTSVVDPSLETKQCREACGRVGAIFTQYQEQPGLLDPHLEDLVTPLIEAIRQAVHNSPRAASTPLPNLHILSSLLYILTTVRGYKTVSRFFPHEAADLEPCLEAAEEEAKLVATRPDTWSTLYCLTLWLGMVLLTPFDLTSIDSGSEKGLSLRILELGVRGLGSASRTRDASAWMLAKYFTRPDVTGADGLTSFVAWTRKAWTRGNDVPVSPSADDAETNDQESRPSSSMSIVGLTVVRSGALQAWNQTLKSAPRSVLKTIWLPLIELTTAGPSKQGDGDFKASSALRKLRVVVAGRAALTALPPRIASWRYARGARSLLVNFAQSVGTDSAAIKMFTSDECQANFQPRSRGATSQNQEAEAEQDDDDDEDEDEDEDVPEQVEEVIELLLSSLTDSDTVVRWAAAKAVGRITNRLSKDFGDQVLENLLDRCFSFRETDKAWHGGCLALAELTRRGLLLPERLETVVPLVCDALHFEQVSGNHAVGQHVRDAACYVCWAFARAYAPDVLEPFVARIATALIQVAVFDREINCRRAAAAAVQEHVGRQGTFPNGIDVVTVADYWTLSSRRHAYTVVAAQIASLGEQTYRLELINHLATRKLSHQDVHIRELAAEALGSLCREPTQKVIAQVNEKIIPDLISKALASETGESTAASKLGSGLASGTVQSRHGAILGVAALTEVMQEHISADNQGTIRNLVPSLEKIRAYRGRGGEVVRQAACRLLARVAAANSWTFKEATGARYLQTVDECARHSNESIRVAAVDALRVLSRTRFKLELSIKCIDNYLAGLKKADETISARRGFALSLGALPPEASAERRAEVLQALSKEIKNENLPGGKDQDDPQTRQYALLSMGRLLFDLPNLSSEELQLIVETLKAALNDYATDRRGDVGSWVREVGLEIVTALLEAQSCNNGSSPGRYPQLADKASTTSLVALVLRQAVEKLDRLLERAFGLLRRLLLKGPSSSADPPALVELAYRRVCHDESYRPDAATSSDRAANLSRPTGDESVAWPPVALTALEAAMKSARGGLEEAGCESAIDLAAAEKMKADRSASIFEALVPLLDVADYRPALVRGLIVSVGGITEYIAKGSKAAVLKYLQGTSDEEEASKRQREVSDELVRILATTSHKDSASDAKRLLAPLFSTIGVLLAQDCFPASSSEALISQALSATRTTRDLSRLRASISVFIGLLRWPGVIRRQAMEVLLQFLGYSFPTVRQATAQALYIRLLEESSDFDLRSSPTHDDADQQHVVPAEQLAEASELVSITPWSTDNEEVLSAALRKMYEAFRIDLPQGGQSMLAPRKTKEATQQPKESEYADLVRENHY